jgi:hypothetical protein
MRSFEEVSRKDEWKGVIVGGRDVAGPSFELQATVDTGVLWCKSILLNYQHQADRQEWMASTHTSIRNRIIRSSTSVQPRQHASGRLTPRAFLC